MQANTNLKFKINNLQHSQGWFIFWYFIKIIILVGVYMAAAKFGLSLAFATKQVSAVWPPTGIAFAALFLFGFKLWPGVFIGAFLANLLTDEPPLIAISIAIGNTLEAFVGSYLLKNWIKIRPELDSVRDVVYLIVVGGIFSTAISATIGVSSLIFGNLADPLNFWSIWSVWWIGDMLSIMVITPLIFSWSSLCSGPKQQKFKWESVVLLFATVILSVAVFQGQSESIIIEVLQLQYVVFPLLIWAALRFSQREVTSVTFIISGLAILHTLRDHGPFGAFSGMEIGLLSLQLFTAVMSMTALILAAAVSERRRSEQTKSEFVSIASHQLRTPLTAIKWITDILGEDKKLSKKQQEHIRHVVVSNDRLIKLVDDLLRVTRIEGGRVTVKKQDTNIVSVIERAILLLKPYADARKQKIVLSGGDKPKNAFIDPVFFNETIENLLNNAIAYGSENSTINITISKIPHYYLIEVNNQGNPIPISEQNKIFAKFYRSPEAVKLKPTGTGLGLFIAKSAVEANGGEIGFQSSVSAGTTFSFTVPRK